MKRRLSSGILFVVACSVITASASSRAALLYTPSQYNKLYNEKVALEYELESLKKQYGNEKSGLEATITELTNKIESLNRQIENLRKERDRERDQNAARVKELENLNELLKKKGSDREQQLINESKKMQNRYEADLAALRDECAKEREKCRSEIDRLKSAYEKKLADLNRDMAARDRDLNDLKKLTEKQKEELARLEEQAKELEKQLADEIRSGDINLKRFHDRLIININDRISFDSGSAELKKDVMPALKKIMAILVNYPENRIVVEGHTDNVPISTSRFRDNWQLSTERALSVLKYLLSERRLNPTRFSAAGYGEYSPIVPNDTPQNRSLNRRVDIVVVPRAAAR